MKHIEVRHLWVHQLTSDKNLKLNKVNSTRNVAGVGATHLDRLKVADMNRRIGITKGPVDNTHGYFYDGVGSLSSIERGDVT